MEELASLITAFLFTALLFVLSVLMITGIFWIIQLTFARAPGLLL